MSKININLKAQIYKISVDLVASKTFDNIGNKKKQLRQASADKLKKKGQQRLYVCKKKNNKIFNVSKLTRPRYC